MNEIQVLLERANKLHEVADHLAFVTYPVVKEPKLIFTIAEHVLNACILAMDALLYYELLYKRINSYNKESFAEKISILKTRIAPKYGIERKHVFLIEEIKNMLENRQNSKIEFAKRNEVIFCSHDYDVKIISIEKAKNYVYESKAFLNRVNTLLKPTQNARRL